MKLFISLCYLITIHGFKVETSTNSQDVESQSWEDNPISSNTPHVRHSESKRFRPKDGYLHDYRYNGLNVLDDINLKYCRRPAKCQALNYTTCMGSKLPYYSTTLDLTDLVSQEKVQEELHLYQYLRYVPKCWAVIQPFLCSLYMPKCENGLVDLPSKEMCRITLGPCKILYNSSVFPKFMKCDDKELFPTKCKNDIHEVKFNTTGFCMEPLVRTEHQDWFYPGVDGCGLRCKDSLYTEDEHGQIHKLMIYCVLLCMLLNLFAIIALWKTANKYPALAIYYTNFCFFISYCGWLIQFLGSETRNDIVCKKDGTLRKHEPSANENLSCVTVFVIVYYFLIAGVVWIVIFAYAWYMNIMNSLGKIQDRVDKKRAYFHLISWSLPLILTITTMALSEIDGNYMVGICFVGFVNPPARIGLLLAPLGVAIVIVGYIIVRGVILLIQVKANSRDVISEKSSRTIRSNIIRLSVFALFMVVCCIITFVYHTYMFTNSEIWSENLQKYILCKLTSLSSDFSHCKSDTRPSVAMLQLQLLAVFGSGIAVASWVWCASTYRAWVRYIRRIFDCEVEEPMKFQKHKIIAQAFDKRKKFNEGHKISIDCQNNNTDPVGLHFDLNSAASNEVSTTWAANLPRLVNRRGAVPNEAVTYTASSNSEMSYSLQHINIESRRNSGESQVSVQISEVTVNSRMHRNRVRHKRKVLRGSRDCLNRSRRSRVNRKCGSITSLDSQFGKHLLNNILNTNYDFKPNEPNLDKRRVANAGLEEHNMNSLLTNTKLLIPYEKNLQHSQSDDENMSVTISESKFNVVLNNRSNNNLDLSDQLIMKSLRQGLQIKELNSSVGSVSLHKKENVEDYYNVDSDSDNSSSDDLSCPELKQLLQSSLNSAASTATQNRSSKQSKTSIDVAVQANANEIATQTAALCGSETQKIKNSKSSKVKTDVSNRKHVERTLNKKHRLKKRVKRQKSKS